MFKKLPLSSTMTRGRNWQSIPTCSLLTPICSMLNMLVSYSICVIMQLDVKVQSFGIYIHERNLAKHLHMEHWHSREDENYLIPEQAEISCFVPTCSLLTPICSMLNMLVTFSICVITQLDVKLQSFGTYIHERNLAKHLHMARYLLLRIFFYGNNFLTIFMTKCSRTK